MACFNSFANFFGRDDKHNNFFSDAVLTIGAFNARNYPVSAELPPNLIATCTGLAGCVSRYCERIFAIIYGQKFANGCKM
jgi:hypothetical protein